MRLLRLSLLLGRRIFALRGYISFQTHFFNPMFKFIIKALLYIAFALILEVVYTNNSFAQKKYFDTIPYAMEHHTNRLNVFAKEPITQGNILLLGDSHTEFGNWKKLFNDTTVINRGIAGDITFGLLARIDDILLRKPRILSLEIGINDIAKDIPDDIITKNILTIITRIHAASPTTKILLTSIFPTNPAAKKEYPDAVGKNDRVRLINARLQREATKRRFTFIDAATALSNTKGDLDKKYGYEDGLHLNASGYQRWVELLKKHL